LQSVRNGQRNTLPLFCFGFQLTPPQLGKPIKFCATICLGFTPMRGQPTGFLHPMKRRKQRPWLYVKGSAGHLCDPPRNAHAMQLFKSKSFEYQQVKRSLEKNGLRIRHLFYIEVL